MEVYCCHKNVHIDWCCALRRLSPKTVCTERLMRFFFKKWLLWGRKAKETELFLNNNWKRFDLSLKEWEKLFITLSPTLLPHWPTWIETISRILMRIDIFVRPGLKLVWGCTGNFEFWAADKIWNFEFWNLNDWPKFDDYWDWWIIFRILLWFTDFVKL